MTTLPPERSGEQPAQPSEPVQPAASQQPYMDAQQYGQAPPGASQQPQPAPQYQMQPVDPAANTITLNYWLSAFFAWIPALIFWVLEKDKGNQRALAFHVSNLNFSLVRTGVGIAITILTFIPYIGWLMSLVLWLVSVALFVVHIMAAVKATDEYKKGGNPDPFMFNYPLIK